MCIRDRDILIKLTDSKDEDIAEAADEALSMILPDDFGDEEEGDEDDDEDEDEDDEEE